MYCIPLKVALKYISPCNMMDLFVLYLEDNKKVISKVRNIKNISFTVENVDFLARKIDVCKDYRCLESILSDNIRSRRLPILVIADVHFENYEFDLDFQGEYEGIEMVEYYLTNHSKDLKDGEIWFVFATNKFQRKGRLREIIWRKNKLKERFGNTLFVFETIEKPREDREYLKNLSSRSVSKVLLVKRKFNSLEKEYFNLKEKYKKYNLFLTKGILEVFSKLENAYNQFLKTNKSRSIALYAPPGFGKTTIVRAFLQSIGVNPEECKVEISENSQASEEIRIFGSAKGAFTGAVDKKGTLERYDILWIDNLQYLPKSLQKRLLEPMETGKALKIGGGSINSQKGGWFFIFTSNVTLEELSKKGVLLKDLFARLTYKEQINVPNIEKFARDYVKYIVEINGAKITDNAVSQLLKILQELRIELTPRHLKDILIAFFFDKLEMEVKEIDSFLIQEVLYHLIVDDRNRKKSVCESFREFMKLLDMFGIGIEKSEDFILLRKIVFLWKLKEKDLSLDSKVDLVVKELEIPKGTWKRYREEIGKAKEIFDLYLKEC